MGNPTKFLGSIPVVGWQFQIDSIPPASLDTVTLTDGDYYMSDDGAADDFVAHFEAKINAASSVVDTVTVTIDSDGLLSIQNTTDFTVYTITWDTSDDSLRDVLRHTGATSTFSDTALVSPRAVRYFAHTIYPTRVDIPDDSGRMSMSEADDGTLFGADAGPLIRRYDVTVRFSGPHRTTVANGYTEFRDLFVYSIKTVRKIRWYPDATVATAWAELTNPFGYHVVKEKSMKSFKPKSVVRNSYTWYTTTFDLQVQP